MNVRFKKTDKGEMAILPRAEYEALIERLEEAEEDAGTVRLIDRGLREIAEGAPTFPMDVANRIADGENPVRVFREWKGMTQVELAARTGLSQGHVSDIESGRRVGTVAALRMVADALGVPLDLLA